MLNLKNNIIKQFTLIETVVALAVFLTLTAIVLNFYDAVFNTSELSSDDSIVFSNAKTALDIISRDIQCIYYQNGMTPFWHKGATVSGDDKYNEDLLAFISSTPLPASNSNFSKLCEIKYQLFNPAIYDLYPDSAGLLLRSATSDADGSKWNFQYNFNVGESGATNAFTANEDSSSQYYPLISYVTELNFACYDKNGIEYTDASDSTVFPYSIKISLKLMDKNSWKKMTSILNGRTIFSHDYDIWNIRLKSEKEFIKIIYIGDHGQ